MYVVLSQAEKHVPYGQPVGVPNSYIVPQKSSQTFVEVNSPKNETGGSN